jgi:hypothetical protein
MSSRIIGVIRPILAVLLAAGLAACSTTPASTATGSPSAGPSGLTLPASCRFVNGPVVQSDSTTWSFDCGSANADAKAMVKATLAQQGWAFCGGAGGRDVYTKGSQTLYVEAPGSAPGAPPNIMITNTRVGNCP